ncbi:MAG: MoaD-like protein [Dehalococcoidia bacterium]|nr:MoaD-like protein [Dehalococcoidia bacterium]
MATTVNVEIYGPFADIAGTRQAKVELDEPTVKGLLKVMKKQWGPSFIQAIMDESGGEFNLSVLVLVNHHPVYHLQGLRTELKDGDTVVFIPPAAGGALASGSQTVIARGKAPKQSHHSAIEIASLRSQ